MSETHVYKRVGDHEIRLDFHRPDVDESPPVIVWIHGGALILGARGGLGDFRRNLFLNAGYAVASIDYRLAPETKLPEIIEDLKDAFCWIHDNADDLGIDATRMGVVGHSAGGYLTLMSGIAAEPSPQALVAYYGYGDIVGDWYSKPDEFYRQQELVTEQDARKAVGAETISEGPGERGPFYLWTRQNGLWPVEVAGFDPHEQPEAFDPYCPVRHVSAEYPPTILLHGDKDTDVPYEQSVMMADALKSAGVAHEFITISDGGHGFDGNRQDPQVVDAINRAVSFLDRHVKDGG